MPNLPELQLVSTDAAIWHTFDPSVKADLFSTAISTEEGLCLVDPIAVDPAGFSQLEAHSRICGIAITNQNHWRTAVPMAEQLSLPIYAHADARLGASPEMFVPVTHQDQIGNTLEVIRIVGAAPGEISLFNASGEGTVIVGDALINFEPYGFSLLPPKYCAEHRTMKKSLAQLMNRSFERMFFAHGMPIISGAGARLRELLGGV